MQIATNVHHFDTDPFNWYLIQDGGRLTVVDSGFPGHYATFLNGLQSIGRSLSDVEAIILTHAHADHTGFAERLRRASGAPVFIHVEDRDAVKRKLNLPWLGLLGNAWQPFGRSILWRAIQADILQMPHVSQVYTFKDNQVLDIPGKPHVIHAPGHTLGEVAFYLPQHAVLFSGDVLVTRDLLTGQHGGPQVPAASLNSDDKGARRSIDRLNELGRVTMLPGHGKPWVGTMSEAVEIARAGTRSGVDDRLARSETL